MYKSYMRLAASYLLVGLFIFAAVLLGGHFLYQEVSAELLGTELHVTPMQYYGGGYGGGCVDMYGYPYPC